MSSEIRYGFGLTYWKNKGPRKAALFRKFAKVFCFVKTLQSQLVNIVDIFGLQFDEVPHRPQMGGLLSHNFKIPI